MMVDPLAAGLEEKAAELGKTPGELMIIASLMEPRATATTCPRWRGSSTTASTAATRQHRRHGIDASNTYALGCRRTTALTTEQLGGSTPPTTPVARELHHAAR